MPISPINGVTDAVVASQFMLRSSLASSSLTPICRVRSSAVRLVTLPRRFDLPLDFFVAEIENGDQGRGAELFAGDHHGFHAGGLAKCAQETRVGLAGAAERLPLGKDDGPGIDGKTDQNDQHSRCRTGRCCWTISQRSDLQKEGNGRFERAIRLLISNLS